MDKKRGNSYILSTTLQKAFSILECIAESQPVSVTEIRRTVGLTKGNVHSLLASLEKLGYVRKTANGYALTFKLFALGYTVPHTQDLIAVARPRMERIAAEEGYKVYLTAPADNRLVNLEQVRPRSDIQVADDFAMRYEVHCTASGKLYLAWLSDEERERVRQEVTLNAVTEMTITDWPTLDEAIRVIQKQGYSLELCEHSPYINGIAAPILDHSGQFLASISVIGPAMMLTMEELRRVAPRVVEEARWISGEMGYAP